MWSHVFLGHGVDATKKLELETIQIHLNILFLKLHFISSQ